MKIQLINAGKRYNYTWILKDINFEFNAGKTYGITGANGAGKTTLLSLIAGYFKPSTGHINYSINNNPIAPELCYTYISWASPSLELIEEFTLIELITFHQTFKPYLNNATASEIFNMVGLQHINQKPIKEYSTGMKQRVKVVLALLSNTPIVLLDEPTSNFDTAAIDWYTQLVTKYKKDRIVIIASNTQQDFVHVDSYIHL